jgi:paired small multidrug resistance pump
MGWILVILASLFEVVGILGLKKFSSEKNLNNGILLFVGFIGSLTLLYSAFNYIQMSIAYSVWVGIGTASAVILNMFFFNEPKNMGRILSLILIIIGVVGLKAVS